MGPRRRCPAPSRRSSSRLSLVAWSPVGLPQGIAGCPDTPPASPCPQGLATRASTWALAPSGLAERGYSKAVSPAGTSKSGGRERTVSVVIPEERLGRLAQPVASRARTSTRSRAGRVCMGHHLTEPRVDTGKFDYAYRDLATEAGTIWFSDRGSTIYNVEKGGFVTGEMGCLQKVYILQSLPPLCLHCGRGAAVSQGVWGKLKKGLRKGKICCT